MQIHRPTNRVVFVFRFSFLFFFKNYYSELNKSHIIPRDACDTFIFIYTTGDHNKETSRTRTLYSARAYRPRRRGAFNQDYILCAAHIGRPGGARRFEYAVLIFGILNRVGGGEEKQKRIRRINHGARARTLD